MIRCCQHGESAWTAPTRLGYRSVESSCRLHASCIPHRPFPLKQLHLFGSVASSLLRLAHHPIVRFRSNDVYFGYRIIISQPRVLEQQRVLLLLAQTRQSFHSPSSIHLATPTKRVPNRQHTQSAHQGLHNRTIWSARSRCRSNRTIEHWKRHRKQTRQARLGKEAYLRGGLAINPEP